MTKNKENNMRNLFFLFFISELLLTTLAFAQNVPLDQKEWYSKSTRGQVPPTWPFGGGAPAESYVENIGFLDATGSACMPRADANCYPIVTFAPGSAAEVRIRDGNGTTLSDVVASDGSNLNTTFLALLAKNIGYCWDSINNVWRPMETISSSGAETVSNNLWSLLVKNLMYGYDSSFGDWRAINSTTVGGGIIGRMGLITTSLIYGYDPATVSFTYPYVWNPINTIFNGYIGLVTTSQNMVYNSSDTSWYRMSGNSSGDVYTNKRGINTYSPTKETTTNIAGSATIVLTSKEIIGYPNWCIYLANNDSADPLTDVDVQVSPDNFATASSTIDLAEPVACDTLAAGAGCVSCYSGSSFRYVRVRATAHATNQVSSLDAWITANVN
jgi:hypothetical protein